MRYVAITYRGLYFITGSFIGGEIAIAGEGVGPRTIFERLELGDDRVAFRTLDGRYVTARESLGLHSGERGPEQTFVEVWLPDDRIALQSYSGGFVSASAADFQGVPQYSGEIGDGEKFYYEKPPDELLPKGEGEVARPTESEPARPEPSVEGVAAQPARPEPSVEGVAAQPPRPRLRDKIFRRLGR